MATSWKTSSASIAGIDVQVARGGSGNPVLVLHHDIGTLPRLPFYDRLAERYDVLIPEHPGFGESQRPEWMRNVRDLAVVYRSLLACVGIEKAALVGLGFGGWIAAEMATMAPRDLAGLVLVGPMGIHPPEGYILDQALLGYTDYAREGFHDQAAFDRLYGKEPSTEQLVTWDICREMSFRIAWKPYMYSQTLPHLLKSMGARTLVVWGEQDRVVPPVTAQSFMSALPDARLATIPGCGHCVEMERPEDLGRLVVDFLG